MRPLLLLPLAVALTACGDKLESTLEKVKANDAFPPEAVAKLPTHLQGKAWKVRTVARASSEYPLQQGGKLCRAGAYLLEEGPVRQVALITLCGGKPLPAGDGSAFITFPPASSEAVARTRLDLNFSVALGPQQEVVWLTERTLIPTPGIHLQERAWREENGKMVPILDHVVAPLSATSELPEAARKGYTLELSSTYAAGFVGQPYPLTFTMNLHRRGRPTTVRLEWQEGRGYGAPPLIPGVAQPPVSAPATDGGSP